MSRGDTLNLFKRRGDLIGGSWCGLAVQRSRDERVIDEIWELPPCKVTHHTIIDRADTLDRGGRAAHMAGMLRRMFLSPACAEPDTLRARERERVPLHARALSDTAVAMRAQNAAM